MLELNKLDKKISFDKFTNSNLQQHENNDLDKSVNSIYSVEKFIENGDHYYISDSSVLGYNHKLEKHTNETTGIKFI